MHADDSWQKPVQQAAVVFLFMATVLVLYFGRDLLIPIVLAILFAFILSPVVNAATRRGIPRGFSVLLTLIGVGVLLLALGWLITAQSQSLLAELPKYEENIRGRIHALKEAASQNSSSFSNFLSRIRNEVAPAPPAPSEPAAGTSAATPGFSLASVWPSLFTSTLSALGTLALALILAAYMLLQQEDLRNRFLWLMGRNHMTATTKAIDDGGRRVSRFLLVQCLVNFGYGVILGISLFLLGIPYAALWGIVGAVIRFIPYVGPWVGSLAPLTMSLVSSSNWTQPLLVAGLIVVIELLMNNLIEPMLFGSSIGVSEVAFLIFAAVWAYLWGPIGLILAGPLTVVFVILGERVPYLSPLHILLSSRVEFEPSIHFFQRLIAQDTHEATRVLNDYVEKHGSVRGADDVAIPSLYLLLNAHRRDELNREELDQAYERASDIFDKVLNHPMGVASPEENSPQAILVAVEEMENAPALRIVEAALRDKGWKVTRPSEHLLMSEIVDWLEQEPTSMVCVIGYQSQGDARIRYLAKRLQRSERHLVVVGQFGSRSNSRELDDNYRDLGIHRAVDGLSLLLETAQAVKPVVLPTPTPAEVATS